MYVQSEEMQHVCHLLVILFFLAFDIFELVANANRGTCTTVL